MSALIFDLDGTLVDSVYEHVAAWHVAFAERGVRIPAFEYHKRIGMTGEALVAAIDDAFTLGLSAQERAAIERRHSDEYHRTMDRVTRLPRTETLWNALDERNIAWAIATSAGADDANKLLAQIDCPRDAIVVTKSTGTESKPSPSVFGIAAAKLGVKLNDAMIVGDSVWDMLASRRAGALGIGVLTGGYGREELVAAGAYRVYADVVEMARRLGELGL